MPPTELPPKLQLHQARLAAPVRELEMLLCTLATSATLSPLSLLLWPRFLDLSRPTIFSLELKWCPETGRIRNPDLDLFVDVTLTSFAPLQR